MTIYSGHSGPDYGLGSSNSTLRYAYGDSPLGPWKSGGVLVDSRAPVLNQDGSRLQTTNAGHNTHGSIELINGQWYLVDLPGYGFAQRGKEGRENIQRIIEDYILEREQLTNLFVLIDCRHEPQKIDLEFMEWLGENEIPFSLIFTKIDKISKGRLQENLKVYQTKLLESWEELPPILLSSSEKKEGRDKILNYIDEINKSL